MWQSQASPSLQADMSVVLAADSSGCLCLYKSVAPHLIKKTLSSLLSLLGIRGGACCHGPSAQAVRQNGEALQFASEDLRDTRKADGPCRNTAGNMLKHQLAA